MRQREENVHSAVALVPGGVKYKQRSLSTSLSIPLTKLLSFSTSAMVLASVTFFTFDRSTSKGSANSTL